MDFRVGLCSVCAHARVIESGKGSRFHLCLRSKEDANFRRYPPLPVVSCAGFEPGRPRGPSEPTSAMADSDRDDS